MQISVKTINKVKVVEIEGKLNTRSAPDAEKQLARLIESGEKRILVNLEKLEYVSSSGLRVLLAAAKKLNASDGELRICGVKGFVEEIFQISGFSTIFTIYENETEALKGF